jgi:hypothetical protein
MTKIDDLVKSQKMGLSVIRAKAGIQLFQYVLDPGFRRGDDPRDFLRDHQNSNDPNIRASFEFGIWSLFGIWILKFGISNFLCAMKNPISKIRNGADPVSRRTDASRFS